MQYTVWKIEGDKASEITAPDSYQNAMAALVTLNGGLLARPAYLPKIRYDVLPLGGSPFDA
jgi:hypothetical protein